MKQKWIFDNDGGIYFPISAAVQLHITPGPGIYKITRSSNPNDLRIGLARIAEGDKFEFVGKVYDLDDSGFCDRIVKCWESDIFMKGKKNLSVVMNGLKGSGKTYMAKQLANRMDLPILILNEDYDGAIIDFLTNIEFECVVLIDEAEKVFNKDKGNSQVLLKILDGINNAGRKLYILTTNQLNIDDNLIGRPGRIRYTKKFISLPIQTVKEVIKDELLDQSKTNEILEVVNELSISTIDVLRSLIEEYNIFGDIDKQTFSIPLASYTYSVLAFWKFRKADIPKLKELIKKYNPKNEDLEEVLQKPISQTLIKLHKQGDQNPQADNEEDESEEENVTTERMMEIELYGRYSADSWKYGLRKMSTNCGMLFTGSDTSIGEIIEAPDNDGFFLYRDSYGGEISVGYLIKMRSSAGGLYGNLSLTL